jgi:hypothetical protein
METPTLTPTSAKQWKGKIQVEGTDLTLPSGNVARVKQLDPTAFMSSGIIPDPLSAIITKAINTKKGLPPKLADDLMKDPAMLSTTLEMFDRVLVHCVVEPPIDMPPPCAVEVEGQTCGLYANQDVHKTPTRSGHHRYEEGERDPDVLYADTVEMDDKMFIFNWVLGGTRDLEQFREQLQGGMGVVPNGQDVQRPAKRTIKRR